MSEDIHRRIVAFLGGEFARTEERSCILLELFSAQPGQRGDSLKTWDRRETPDVFDGLAHVENLATDVIRLAEEHADSFSGGSHRYELRTQQHMGKRVKHAFRILVEGDSDGPSGGEDPPTEKGLVGQLMRHLEFEKRNGAMIVQSTIGTLSRMVADFAEENRALRRDKNEAASELEAARSMQDQRDLDGLRQVNADRRKEMVAEKIMTFLPVVAARMLGSAESAAPSAPTQESVLASELAESLDPEQFTKIAAALTPKQQLILFELLQAAKKKTAGAVSGEKKPGAAATPSA